MTPAAQEKISSTAQAIPDSDSIEDVVAKLATNTESGLTQDETARRLERHLGGFKVKHDPVASRSRMGRRR